MKYCSILILLSFLTQFTQAQEKKNIKISLGHIWSLPTEGETITGTTTIKGTENPRYDLSVAWVYPIHDFVNIEYGVRVGVHTVNDNYQFDSPTSSLPDQFREKEYGVLTELGFLGFPMTISKSFFEQKRMSPALLLGLEPTFFIPYEDYTSGVFDAPYGRTILIERNYKGNGESGFSPLSPPKFFFYGGIGTDFKYSKDSTNKIGIELVIAKGPKNMEESTFEAFPWSTELHSTGNLNINRNYVGARLSYSFSNR